MFIAALVITYFRNRKCSLSMVRVLPTRVSWPGNLLYFRIVTRTEMCGWLLEAWRRGLLVNRRNLNPAVGAFVPLDHPFVRGRGSQQSVHSNKRAEQSNYTEQHKGTASGCEDKGMVILDGHISRLVLLPGPRALPCCPTTPCIVPHHRHVTQPPQPPPTTP